MSSRRGSMESWFRERLGFWRDAGERVRDLRQQASPPADTVLAAVRSYPEIARDLAIARRAAPTSKVTRQLAQIYSELHRLVFKSTVSLSEEAAQWIRGDVPRIAGELRAPILWITLLFAASGLAGWWLVASHPELIALFASESMIDGVHRGKLWTDDLLNVVPSSLLSISIFSNNIAVTLTAMCVGVAYGLGTIYIIALNGLMLGGIFAFTAEYGLAGRLATFICAHGFTELSIIFVSGAVGVSLGEAIARPGSRARADAFQRAASDGVRLMLVCAVFLIGAGLIEGYVSPNDNYPLWARLLIGLSLWLLFLATLAGKLPNRPAALFRSS